MAWVRKDNTSEEGRREEAEDGMWPVGRYSKASFSSGVAGVRLLALRLMEEFMSVRRFLGRPRSMTEVSEPVRRWHLVGASEKEREGPVADSTSGWFPV